MMSEELNKVPSASPPSPSMFVYTVTPNQVNTNTGTGDPVTLTVGINNPKANGFVACSLIEFGISIGANENDLTDDYSDVQGQSNQSTWGIQKQTFVQSPLIFKVEPATGTTGLSPGESISFELSGINVNNVPGPAPLMIAEVTNQTRLTQADVNKAAELQIISFEAKPASVSSGYPAVLSWVTTGANSCTIDQLAETLCSPAGSPPPYLSPPDGDRLAPTGEATVCPLQTTIYTLTAYAGGGGSIQQAVAVVVDNVTILSFAANPNYVGVGQQVTLSWETQYAVSSTLNPGLITVTGKTQYQVNPQQTTTYELSCEGESGKMISQSQFVKVDPQIITSTKTVDIVGTPGPDGPDGVPGGQGAQGEYGGNGPGGAGEDGGTGGDGGDAGQGLPAVPLDVYVSIYSPTILQVEIYEYGQALVGSYLVNPSGSLTVLASGGAGGTGGAGGAGGAGGQGGPGNPPGPNGSQGPGGNGGAGGAGGAGGSMTVYVEPDAKSYLSQLTFQTSGGQGGSGGTGGQGNPVGSKGTTGGIGPGGTQPQIIVGPFSPPGTD